MAPPPFRAGEPSGASGSGGTKPALLLGFTVGAGAVAHAASKIDKTDTPTHDAIRMNISRVR
jgi:hypothetical protein